MLEITQYRSINFNIPTYKINFNISTFYQNSILPTDIANLSNLSNHPNFSFFSLINAIPEKILPNLFGNNLGIIPQNNPLSISLPQQNNSYVNNQLLLSLLILLLNLLILQNNTQTNLGTLYNFGNIPNLGAGNIPGIGSIPGTGITIPGNIPSIGAFPSNISNIANLPINPSSNFDLSSNSGGNVVNIALQQVGKPYVFGATGPNAFDCSGLVQWAFKKVGVNLPRTADQQFKVGKPVPKNQLQPGDLVFFANTYCPGISHVGIYIGGGKFVHAANSRKGVIVSSLSESYYAQHYAGAKRL